jgi:hypothetical protein
MGLFTSLGTYRPNERVNPEENFTTELLRHILEYSRKHQTELFGLFMSLLDEYAPVHDYSKYGEVETQKYFSADGVGNAYVDLVIQSQDTYFLIEIKVESGLNYYEVDNAGGNQNNFIDQIKKYDMIRSNHTKKIYFLTKYAHGLAFDNCDCFIKSFMWHDVYRIFKTYTSNDQAEAYLMGEIMNYMEDKNMALEKVPFDLTNGISAIYNLTRHLKTALDGISNSRVSVAKNTAGNDCQYMGYNISLDGATKGYVGIWFDTGQLAFQHYIEGIKNYLRDNIGSYQDNNLIDGQKYHRIYVEGNQCFSYFNFSDTKYFCLSVEGQVDVLKQWILHNYQLMTTHEKD